MAIEHFINEKIMQISAYTKAVMDKRLHHTELDLFIVETMEEWTTFQITDEPPSNAKERVFWHIVHEIQAHGSPTLINDLFFKSEINTCLDFFNGIGSYPIDCVGWRPLP